MSEQTDFSDKVTAGTVLGISLGAFLGPLAAIFGFVFGLFLVWLLRR